MAEPLIIIPAILFGVVIGIYEMILVHRDVSVPQHRFGHGVHAFIFAIVGTFISFNVPFVVSVSFLNDMSLFEGATGVILVRLIIAVIMAVKIHGVSAALKSSGMATQGLGETWTHSLIVGLLAGFSPFLWPLIRDFMPAFLQ
jgi:hypothetical protein